MHTEHPMVEAAVRGSGTGWRGLKQKVHNTGSSSTYQAGRRGRFFRRFDRRRGRFVPLPKRHGVLQDQTALHLLRRRRRRRRKRTQPPTDRHGTHEQTGEERNKKRRMEKQKAACTSSKRRKKKSRNSCRTKLKNDTQRNERHACRGGHSEERFWDGCEEGSLPLSGRFPGPGALSDVCDALSFAELSLSCETTCSSGERNEFYKYFRALWKTLCKCVNLYFTVPYSLC